LCAIAELTVSFQLLDICTSVFHHRIVGFMADSIMVR
jgi:hypothetical protein